MTLVCDKETEVDSGIQLDRRRNVRLPQERDVRVSDPYSGRCLEGVTLDISSTGMRLRLTSDCRLRAGRLINLHVGLNAFGCSLANRRNVVTARVVWVDGEGIVDNGFDNSFVVAGIELLVNISASAA